MSKPQQPALSRSGHSPVTESQHAEELVDAHGQPAEKGRVGRVPEENRPGHHPEREQDQPDPERFAERLARTDDRDVADPPAAGVPGLGPVPAHADPPATDPPP